MAMTLERAGVADDLYTLMHRWMGPLAGGLAIGTVIICAIFAAMSGISGAATVSMGIIALPAMLKRGYNKTIAMGCVSAGGALGILIPPSVPMILYATLTGVSIGGLFAGGILPGILLAALFILYIGIRCFFQPEPGTSPSRERKGILAGEIYIPQGGAAADYDYHHGSGVDLCRGLYCHRGRSPGMFRGDHFGGCLSQTELDSDQRDLFPDGCPYGHDHLDSHRGVRFHFRLHRHRGS